MSLLPNITVLIFLITSTFLSEDVLGGAVEYVPTKDSIRHLNQTEFKAFVADGDAVKPCLVCTCCPKGHEGSHEFCRAMTCCYNILYNSKLAATHGTYDLKPYSCNCLDCS